MSLLKVDTITSTAGGEVSASLTNASIKRDVANGVCPLGADSKVPAANLAAALTIEEVANAGALAALTVIAGEIGKRLVRQADTGAVYMAAVLGSGADKWVQYRTDTPATTAVSGVVKLATNAEAAAGTDTTRALTPAAAQAAVAPLRNSLAPRGGIYIDGANQRKVAAALTNQTIGTDPCAVVWGFQVKNGTTSGHIFIGDYASYGNNAFLAYMAANGEMGVYALLDGSNMKYAGYAGFGAEFDGQDVMVAVVRGSSGNAKIYLNGKDRSSDFSFSTIGTVPNGWQTTFSGGYLGIGYVNDNSVAKGEYRFASLYNLELSAADVLEIYQLNGSVPFRFQFGSQSGPLATRNFSANEDNASGTLATVAGNIDGINGVDDVVRAYANTSNGSHAIAWTTTGISAGKRFRIRGSIYVPTGQSNVTHGHILLNGSGVDPTTWTVLSGGRVFAANAAWQTIDTELSTAGSFVALSFYMNDGAAFVGANSTTDDVIYLKGVRMDQLGAVCHFALDEGIGYQLHDSSTNKLDAVMTTTGVHHLIAKREGYVRTPGAGLTWAGSHEGKAIAGSDQQILPSGAVIDLISIKATAGSAGAGLKLGTNNDVQRFKLPAAFTTAKQIGIVSNSGLAASEDAINNCINVDPDDQNYTGTVQVAVHYKITEGSVA